MLNNKQKIIIKLISQHRTLQKELAFVAEVNNGYADTKGEVIIGLLKEFELELMNHLKEEQEEFYSEVLKARRERKEVSNGIESFIAEMEDIGKVVVKFLGTYSTSEFIEQNIKKFGEDLKAITTALNDRIEAEETGVYSYWGVIK